MSPDILYRFTKQLPPADVHMLYLEAGWISRETDPASLIPMIENSFAVCAAFDGTRLIGLMRALSDGVSDAYMLDLAVLSEYRRRGIGKALVQKLSGHLREYGIEWIVCIGAPGTEEFYRTTGLDVMTSHIPYRAPEK